MQDLKTLLMEVDCLFIHKNRNKSPHIYDYTLGRFPNGWTFSVVNSWQKWIDAGFQHDFGAYGSPENALYSFLVYVEKYNIPIQYLMEKEK